MDNWKTQDIRLAVQGKFSLNSRQANDAVHNAQATIKSQKELVKLNHANAANKVEFTQKRLEKAKSSGKRAKLQRRLDKEERKMAFWQKHVDTGTFPPVVFGGKKLFTLTLCVVTFLSPKTTEVVKRLKGWWGHNLSVVVMDVKPGSTV